MNDSMLLTAPVDLTVSQVSNLIKKSLEENFAFVRIKGEISGLKIAPSGHVYFSLKDHNASLAAICWKGVYSNLKIKLEDGMAVTCLGSITSYPLQSKYQLIATSIEHSGVGALMAMLEERRRKYMSLGYFDQARKKPMAFLPSIIGVVTSLAGAVIKDILHRIEERCPTRVIIWPVLVQGQQCAEQVANAIDGFNKFSENRPDLIIIARGGGSIEDLWGFNEEIVLEAVFRSSIAIISAVGHETDNTLVDFVADKRAPTPTAAAEISVPVRADLQVIISDRKLRLQKIIKNILSQLSNNLRLLETAIPNYSSIVTIYEQRIDNLSFKAIENIGKIIQSYNYKLLQHSSKISNPSPLINNHLLNLSRLDNRLRAAIVAFSDNIAIKLTIYDTKLFSYDYKQTLRRGFSLVQDDRGNLIDSVTKLSTDQNITIKFNDGIATAKIN